MIRSSNQSNIKSPNTKSSLNFKDLFLNTFSNHHNQEPTTPIDTILNTPRTVTMPAPKFFPPSPPQLIQQLSTADSDYIPTGKVFGLALICIDMPKDLKSEIKSNISLVFCKNLSLSLSMYLMTLYFCYKHFSTGNNE
jgi:hypothetical protein